MVDNSCCFCKEVLERGIQDSFRDNTIFNERIISESEHFLSLVTVSPITEGHILILPKKHIKGLMQSNSDEYKDFKNFFHQTKRMLDASYGTTVFFEHGVASNVVNGGCGIDHSHVHLLPVSHHEANNFILNIREDFDLSLKSMDEMKKHIPNNSSYLMIGIDLENVFHCTSENIKSQYLRNKMSNSLNLPDSNWRDLTNWEEFNNTIEVLSLA